MLAATKLISAVSPGFSGQPMALIIIGTDTEKAVEEQVQLERHATPWIDIGTAAMNLQIAAHALGLDSRYLLQPFGRQYRNGITVNSDPRAHTPAETSRAQYRKESETPAEKVDRR